MKYLLCLSFFFLFMGTKAQEFTPPVAKKIPKVDTTHGVILRDDYAWLRDKNNTEVINYLYAENAYADNLMKDTRILQKNLFEEMRSRIQEDFVSLPVKRDSYYYYNRYEKDLNYGFHCRRKIGPDSTEEVILDENKIAKDFLYFSLGGASVSPDHRLLLYGVDSKGGNVQRIFFKDIAADTLLPDQLPQVISAVWGDNATIYYLIPEEKTNRAFRLYRHRLGSPTTSDELLYEEKDKTFNLSLYRSSSKKYIFFSAGKTTSDETYVLDAYDPAATPRLIQKRSPNQLYSVNHFHGDSLYILTDWDAPNRRIMKTAISSTDRRSWKDVVPHRQDILIGGYEVFDGFIVVDERSNAIDRVRIINDRSGDDFYISLPDSLLSASSITAYEYEDSKIRVSYQSMVRPLEVIDYDLRTKEQMLVWKDSIPSGFNPDDYVMERLYALAPDGKKVPVTIAYKKGIQKNGKNPCFLSSYGSYGSETSISFSKIDYSYINRGFVVARAHIRGGSDLGRIWYEEGKMLKKKNTFTDFIAAAEHLISSGYTSKGKVAIEGTSAGGLLMGAVTNMRPDLFQAVVANVPFVDVINTMLDETIPLTTFEYEEWGDPRQPEYFHYMLSYSPYDNIRDTVYPHMLLRAGFNDQQVGYWEPAKWVAKLRAMKKDTNLLLFKTVMEGGHGGVSGRYEGLKQAAFEMAFVMKALGISENYITINGRVTDNGGDAVPYANVIVAGTTKGTTTNDDGEFTLILRQDEPQKITVQSIGFKPVTKEIDMNTRIKDLVVKLQPENIQLREVVVSAKAKDPAYAIIRKAVEHRKENLERIKSLSADLYIKSTERLNKIPDKLPKFLTQGEVPDSNDLGLIYLSESVSKYHYQYPEDEKEEMLSSKVAGFSSGYSWNRASDVRFNFYENTVPIPYYSDRPFVSPIAAGALVYYRYRFDGSFTHDGTQVHKIEVTPRMKGDPLFNGYIYIIEDNWQIYNIDLYLTKDAQIEFVDTLFVKEEYVDVNDSIWMPLSVKMMSRIKIFGFDATDLTVGFFSNYRLNPSFPPRFFRNEVFSITDGANKKDSSYWSESRPLVLSGEEKVYYDKSDSLRKVQSSPQYRDSITRRFNRITPAKIILSGYTRYTDGFNKGYRITPVVEGLQYNTVEGPVAELAGYRFNYNDSTYLWSSVNGNFRYGFSNNRFNATGRYTRRLNATSNHVAFLNAGRYVFHFNGKKPISNLVNSIYTLLREENYAKLYEKTFIAAGSEREILNGLQVSTSAELSRRTPLVNSSFRTIVNRENIQFTSNNPLEPAIDSSPFTTHDAVTLNISMTYRHRQKYERHPGRKIILGSKYPEIYASWRKGVSLFGASFNYDFVSVGTGDDIDLKTLGVFKFDVIAGTFFNRTGMVFMDYKHFTGNRTIFLKDADADWMQSGRSRLHAFHTLDYYSHSTNRSFLEVHAQHHFNGFLLSKIPLVRKLKWQEIAGVNAVVTSTSHFTELFVGVDNILKAFRIDFATYYSKGKPIQPQVRVGFSLDF